MQQFFIHTHTDHSTLFSGHFENFKECLESANEQRISLRFADLRNQNLCHAQLDEGDFSQALFTGSNLTGANLSEGIFKGADFSNCDLYNACFAYSDLSCCRFEYAGFGATDFAGCDISSASFASLSCFSLNFAHVQTMDSCTYRSSDGRKITMSKPPIVIHGLANAPIILLDQAAYCGNQILSHQNFLGFLKIAAPLQLTRAKDRLKE
jgi:uncharacterized protein YjbI with pentapeptide repeats